MYVLPDPFLQFALARHIRSEFQYLTGVKLHKAWADFCRYRTPLLYLTDGLNPSSNILFASLYGVLQMRLNLDEQACKRVRLDFHEHHGLVLRPLLLRPIIDLTICLNNPLHSIIYTSVSYRIFVILGSNSQYPTRSRFPVSYASTTQAGPNARGEHLTIFQIIVAAASRLGQCCRYSITTPPASFSHYLKRAFFRRRSSLNSRHFCSLISYLHSQINILYHV